MSRPQGRHDVDSRNIVARIENLDRVDASARFAFGNSAALASISGPIEAKLGVEVPSKATLEVIVRPLSGIPGVTEKALVAILRSVFAPAILLNIHPRTLIQVVFQTLSSPSPKVFSRQSKSAVALDTDLSMTAALINAGSLAFLQASSIPLTGVITAVAVGVTERPGRTLIVDPEDGELHDLIGGGVFAFIFSQSHERQEGDSATPTNGKLVWSSWDGIFNMDEVTRAEELARQKSQEILLLFRQILSQDDLDSKMLVD